MSAGSGVPTHSGTLLPWPLPAGKTFVRIHRTTDGPIWFGPSPKDPPAYRFDAPAGEFRTLYCSENPEGAFAETILRRARRIVPRPFVEARQWTVLQVQREIKLAKLFDNGLIAHGVTADICTGDDYRASQGLAHALYATYDDLDGIAYRARHDNGQLCYALFDRVERVHLAIGESRRFADEKTFTESLMQRYRASWDPLDPLPPP